MSTTQGENNRELFVKIRAFFSAPAHILNCTRLFMEVSRMDTDLDDWIFGSETAHISER